MVGAVLVVQASRSCANTPVKAVKRDRSRTVTRARDSSVARRTSPPSVTAKWRGILAADKQAATAGAARIHVPPPPIVRPGCAISASLATPIIARLGSASRSDGSRALWLGSATVFFTPACEDLPKLSVRKCATQLQLRIFRSFLVASATRRKLQMNPGWRRQLQGRLAGLTTQFSDRPIAKGTLCAQDHGFNLHGASRVAANDKQGRVALCRYILLPLLANDRLRILDDGDVSLQSKKPWSDGPASGVLASHARLDGSRLEIAGGARGPLARSSLAPGLRLSPGIF